MKAEDVFVFGKYKGQRLDKVWREDGNYIMWCLNNVKGFHIEPESIEKKFKEGYTRWENKRTNYMAALDELEEITDRWDFS